jgi:glutamyl/glutaminyl-tRNA synthetase
LVRAPRTRFAPTPSGYLHLGNAWSLALTWLLARSRGGSIHLRIDDLDAARLRGEYLADIFASLEWLGLDWDSGPRDPADFLARHSQRLRLDRYRAALERLLEARAADGRSAVYACACSREQARTAGRAAGTGGLYPGTCRGKGLDPHAPGTHLRRRVGPEETVEVRDLAAGTLRLFPGREMGDFVLRQKNGDPAYQLASVVDDEDLGINLVVRGRDLLPSTGAQLILARRLGAAGFPAAEFLHHDLLVSGEGGEKLSKSGGGAPPGASILVSLREVPHARERLYGHFGRLLGMDPVACRGPADLLAGFSPARIPQGPIRWEEFGLG